MSDLLGHLFDALPAASAFHAPTSPLYPLLKEVARREALRRFGEGVEGEQDFGPFGSIVLPFQRMGNVTSLDLFGIDELVIFALYRANRGRYRKVADIGANIGLHSIVLARCGYEVRAYEPDPATFADARRNLARNGADRVVAINAAVSDRDGRMEFVRVLGNTTGSHLAGSKADPYGELERFPVEVTAIGPIIEWADFVKLDAEGHESRILCATTAEQWRNTDAVVEIGSADNARAVFEHFRRLGVGLFSQKANWNRVSGLDDMPTSHRDGSLFITTKPRVPWT